MIFKLISNFNFTDEIFFSYLNVDTQGRIKDFGFEGTKFDGGGGSDGISVLLKLF